MSVSEKGSGPASVFSPLPSPSDAFDFAARVQATLFSLPGTSWQVPPHGRAPSLGSAGKGTSMDSTNFGREGLWGRNSDVCSRMLLCLFLSF